MLRVPITRPTGNDFQGRDFRLADVHGEVVGLSDVFAHAASMKSKDVWRWFGVIVAIPAGAICGFPCGYFICLGLLLLQGKGSSHNDIFSVYAAGRLGVPLGAILLPFCVRHFTRNADE